MLKQTLKRHALRIARGSGLLRLLAQSKWRRDRLLIWCFHGVAIDDEHLWRPALFLHRRVFEQRLDFIVREGFEVVGLGDGLRRLRRGELTRPSVALTFDDGFYDFYSIAAPLLEKRGLPATVYLTTYYSLHRWPIFNLVCSYMAWKKRDRIADLADILGIGPARGLDELGSPEQATTAITNFADQQRMSGEQRNTLAAQTANALGIDWDQLIESRMLQLISPEEAGDLSRRGFDVQLHTHRRRTPSDEREYKSELQENRRIIEAATGSPAHHYCYPSGVWSPDALPWLTELGIESATTCHHGIVSRTSNPLVLPRYIDRSNLSDDETAAWLSGFSALVLDRG